MTRKATEVTDEKNGVECRQRDAKCDEWDTSPYDDKPETEFEIPFKIVSINVEIEIGEPY